MNCYDDSGCMNGRPAMPSCGLSEQQQNFPIGMAYVPWQSWQKLYPIEQGYCRGTIFSELDLPFLRGRCR